MAFRIAFKSVTTLVFTGLCCASFCAWLVLKEDWNSAMALGPSIRGLIDVLNLFTYTIAHADFNHLIGNMAFILLLGPILEEKYGSGQLALMIVMTALFSGLLNTLLFNTGVLGASGIVFMFIVLASIVNFKGNVIPLTFLLIILLFIGRELYNSFSDDNISQFAHIIGGVLGGVFGFSGMFKKRRIHSE